MTKEQEYLVEAACNNHAMQTYTIRTVDDFYLALQATHIIGSQNPYPWSDWKELFELYLESRVHEPDPDLTNLWMSEALGREDVLQEEEDFSASFKSIFLELKPTIQSWVDAHDDIPKTPAFSFAVSAAKQITGQDLPEGVARLVLQHAHSLMYRKHLHKYEFQESTV